VADEFRKQAGTDKFDRRGKRLIYDRRWTWVR
jgi:hypothetical protein